MSSDPTATAADEVLTDVPDDAPPYSDSYEWQPATAALLVVTLYRCGECGTIASREAWNDAWWRYRSAHMVSDPDEWPAHSRGPHDEDMICPACSYMHRDNDDEGDVREVKGHAGVIVEVM